jgi:hypothetical protein
VSSVLGSPHVAAARRWLGNHLGRDLNIVAEEPLDQIAAAVSVSGVAVSFTTAARAVSWEAQGLVSRRLSPVPLVTYGVAYLRENTSPTLLNMLRVVDELSPPFDDDVPAGCELVWTQQELAQVDAQPWMQAQ